MPTLKDLILKYETEFVQRLKRYSTEDFSEFIDDHVERCRKLLSGEQDKDILLVDDPQSNARNNLKGARKNFYDMVLKHGKEYGNWRQAFAGIFGNIGEYWNAIMPVIEAEKEVAQNLKGLNERKDRFIKSAEKQRSEMGYLCFPLSPLTERYNIKLNIYTKKKDGSYKPGATIDISESLKNPSLTIFGRKPPETSKLHRYLLNDESVSKQHGRFGLNQEGDVVIEYLGKLAGRIEDYEKNVFDISQGESKRLVAAFFDKNEGGSASVYFGGGNKNDFKLEIVLELKIMEGQLKGK